MQPYNRAFLRTWIRYEISFEIDASSIVLLAL